MLIRQNDRVVVIRGDDKDPKTPRKVLRVIPERNKIVVEGVNRVYKHVRAQGRGQQGGRLSKEMPIDVSNVMLYSEKAGRGVRVGVRYTADGRKERYCKVSGASLDVLGPARKTNTRKSEVAAQPPTKR
jgi:large subunit ribosomal protein L24